MNNQREVVYTYRNDTIDSDDPRKLVFEVIDEAVPAEGAGVSRHGRTGRRAEYGGLLNWVNVTFPLGLTRDKAQFETRSARRTRNS